MAGVAVAIARATGEKCARCWRVLPEVGERPRPPDTVPPLHRRGRSPGWSVRREPPRRVAGLAAAWLVLAADQASKAWIVHGLDLPDLRQVRLLPVLNLTMVWNQGVTFGLLNGCGEWRHFALGLVALAWW